MPVVGHTGPFRGLTPCVPLLATLFIAACAVQPTAPGGTPAARGPLPVMTDGPPADAPPDLANTPNAVPRVEPRATRGNPPFYQVDGRRYFVLESAVGYVENGIASWYGSKFHGRLTSSGESYDMFEMTAAHRTLPLPTYARVTNLENGKVIIVRINDRGPFAHDRVIDLSYAAAVKLDIIGAGTGVVEVRAIDPNAWTTAEPQQAPGEPPRLFVQVGAFADRANADAAATRLRDAHLYNMELLTRPEDAPPLWRVRIGPLADVEEADATVLRAAGLGFPEARIVID